MPGGVRLSATESWGTFDVRVTNLTDADRLARVLVLYEGRPDVQYGRDVWVPARATRSTWLLVGPAFQQSMTARREVQVLLYDRTDSKERLILPPGEERIRARGITYRPREPYTAIVLDEAPADEVVFGRLPQPMSAADEATLLAKVFRQTCGLSELVNVVSADSLPATAEAFDGVDHFILASNRLAPDASGLRALRHWLARGGKVWVMLDLVEPASVASLLGDALDFTVLDRVRLSTIKIESPPSGRVIAGAVTQQHERPVEFVRVLLPPGERVEHTIDGWPVWFSRRVGRGAVVFTTLGPRAWIRPKNDRDPPSPYPGIPTQPVAVPALEIMSETLQPPETKAFRLDTFKPMLSDEIGYSVVGRGTVLLVLAGFVLAGLVAGFVLRHFPRRELLGWLGPAAALGAAATLAFLADASRRAAAPTVALAQIVDVVSGKEEASVHGLLAVYRPDSGTALVGVDRGGHFDLDLAGVEGQTRRLILTDLDRWHWENLHLPAGVRLAPSRGTLQTKEPIAAVACFGPDGLEGKLHAGPFRSVSDALLSNGRGRNLAVRLEPDGAFRAGRQDVLPAGQFMTDAVLSDRQQRRQEILREYVRASAAQGAEGAALLAWAEPVDLGFRFDPGARTLGSALLVMPLRLERPVPGSTVTIPGPLIPFERVVDAGPTRPTFESNQSADMQLRFQLPASVLPLKADRARLSAKITAPTRRVTISGRADEGLVELHRVESPLDPLQIDVTDERLLRLDAAGGVHLQLSFSEPLQDTTKGEATKGRRDPRDHKWTIEYLELEVTGRTR